MAFKKDLRLLQSDAWFDEMNAIYAKRRILKAEELAEKLGCEVYKVRCGIVCLGQNSQQESHRRRILLIRYYIEIHLYYQELFLVLNGEGYIRFALCKKKKKLKRRFVVFVDNT